MSSPSPRRARWVFDWALPAALFALLTAAATWPMAIHLRDSVAYGIGDGLLNDWIVRWNLHQLPRDPLRLFDAPILHPAPNTLALSENMLGLSLLFWPLDLLFDDTLLLGNSLIMFSFFSLALAAFAVFRRWTGSWWIGLIAGVAIGFAPTRMPKLTHFQLLSYQPMVLGVFFAARWLRGARRRDAAGLFAALAAQFLFGIYLFVFMGVFLSVFMPVYALARRWRLSWRRLAIQGAVGAAALAVVAYPIYLPYKYLRDELGMRAQPDLIVEASVNLTDFLRYPATNLLWGKLSSRIPQPYSRFPWEQEVGLPLTFYALAAAGLAAGAWRLARRRRVRGQGLWLAGAAAGLTCLALMFGPRLHLYKDVIEGVPMPYSVFARFFPGFEGIRGPARFILPASLGLAMAGLLPLGWACRAWRRRRPRLAVALPALLALALTAESLNRPLYLHPVPPKAALPAAVRALAAQPPAPVLVWPLDPEREFDYLFMYYQTYFWFPMVNGRSGYYPPGKLEALRSLAAAFPSAEALARLKGQGVRYILVFGGLLEQARREADFARLEDLRRGGRLQVLHQLEGDRLYRIR